MGMAIAPHLFLTLVSVFSSMFFFACLLVVLSIAAIVLLIRRLMGLPRAPDSGKYFGPTRKDK